MEFEQSKKTTSKPWNMTDIEEERTYCSNKPNDKLFVPSTHYRRNPSATIFLKVPLLAESTNPFRTIIEQVVNTDEAGFNSFI
jgi:hypothetical protein